MPHRYDFIIAGQGLAGTLLAWQLELQGKSVLVIDQPNPNSASNVAAGIIHPITGRRLVKTWLFDQAWPFALRTYAQLEKKLNISLFSQLPIVELYTSVKNKNDWLERSSAQGYAELIEEELPPAFHQHINCPLGGIKIIQAGFLNTRLLLSAYREYLEKEQRVISGNLLPGSIVARTNEVSCNGIVAGKLIFCDGFNGKNNPFFNSIPFQPSKGEIITVHCEGLDIDYMLNKHIFIQPAGGNLFRVGSTYQWDTLNENPTQQALDFLASHFESIVKLPCRITEHVAGIRPTIKNRRPVIGLSSGYPCIGIFNGLGTKGVLLAPLLSAAFAGQLVSGKTIPYEHYRASQFS